MRSLDPAGHRTSRSIDMIERELDIATGDGAMNTFVVHPEEGGPFPVVLFYMDAPGKREELHDMARRIATVGYFVVLPNLYYRRSSDYWLRERTEAGFAEMFTYMHALDRGTVERDTAAMLHFVDGEPAADAARIGAVGYCMSGPFVIWAAAAFADRLRCIASIYGANLVTAAADSAHRMLDKVRCEAYFACAETDKWAPPETVAELEAALAAAGTRHRLEWYPGAEHGFAFPLRAGIYHKPSAERHWERLFSLFRRNLAQPPAGAAPAPNRAAGG
jgi:carboxymethylenebutenolidase